MKYEYINSSVELTHSELESHIEQILQLNSVKTIILPSFFVKKARGLIKDSDKKLSCLIDYPLGMSDSLSRITMGSNVKSYVDTLDITINANLLCNRKFSLIKKEIASHIDNFPDFKPRYILEYRHFSAPFIKKACEILNEFDIKDICLSSGYFADNIDDYIIASYLIKKHIKNINIILYCSCISDKKINLVEKHDFGVIRTNSIATILDFMKIKG